MKLFISKLHYKKDLDFYETSIIMMLRFFSLFYLLAVRFRNKLYDMKLLPSYSSKSYIVSIGNLTTGGVGKTPVTAEIAKYFLALNKQVAILSRGYGAKLSNKEPKLVSDGSGALYTASMAGDEPVWLGDNCKGAYVITCASRIKAERYAYEKFQPEVIILDDGFQHRKMKRDLDIVLIDSKNKFGNKYLLPAGPLREEISEIKRAHKVIVVNKSYDSQKSLQYCDYLKKRFKKEIYLCQMVPDCVYDIYTGEILPENSRIMAFSAIGQSKSFYDFLKKDYRLIAVLEFEDHHKYDVSDITKIIGFAQEEGIECVVTTEKDAVKLIDIINDIELPIKFYALKLKAYMDVKEVCGV